MKSTHNFLKSIPDGLIIMVHMPTFDGNVIFVLAFFGTIFGILTTTSCGVSIGMRLGNGMDGSPVGVRYREHL